MNKRAYRAKPWETSSTSLFVTLVVWVLLAPMVSATTTLLAGDGDTDIQYDYTCGVALAISGGDISHVDYDSVYVHMNAGWWDWRSSPADTRVNSYWVKATYSATEYKGWWNHSTTGNEQDSHDFGPTVPSVRVDTWMSVVYNVSVYANQAIQCTLEQSTSFHFVSP